MNEQGDKDQASPTPSSEQRVDQLLTAANEAAKYLNRRYMVFLVLFSVQFAVSIGLTSDKQLLLGETLPPAWFDFAVPIIPFFVILPFAYLTFHVYLLLHLYVFSRRLADFDDAVESLPVDQDEKEWRRRMIYPFLYSYARLNTERKIVKMMLQVAVWTTMIVVPVALLCWIQRQFLPYHEVWVTWLHRLYIFMDLACLWLLWQVSPSSNKKELIRSVRRIRYFGRIILTPPGLGTVAVAFFSVFILTVPDESVDCIVTRLNSNRVDDLIHRNLVLKDKWLVEGEPSSELKQTYDKESDDIDAVLKDITGLNLRERDLRYADFTDSKLLNAKLQGCDLEHATLVDCDLRGAVFRDDEFPTINLKGAKLSGARLQDANMQRAQLQRADLSSARLDGANLERALLYGADLNSAVLDGVSLMHAGLHGADLSGAELKGAKLIMAKLWGVKVKEAQILGVDLRGAEMGGKSLLEGGHVKLCDLRDLRIGKPDPDPRDWKDAITSIRKLPDGNRKKFALGRLNNSLETPQECGISDFDKNLCDKRGPFEACRTTSNNCNEIPAEELADLTCENPWIARRLAIRTRHMRNDEPERASALANALLAKKKSAACSGWKHVSEELVRELEEIAEGSP